jgi:hypothetical protein
MKRTPRPLKPASFSDSTRHQLNMYALSAATAGVGFLAFVQSAEARIVYTNANRVIPPNGSYNLDVNHDGKTDFVITNSVNCPEGATCVSTLFAKPANTNNGVEGLHSSHGGWNFAYALNAGARIGPKRPFPATAMVFAIAGSCPVVRTSQWCKVTDRYLGLRFEIHGKTHYGWARMTVGLGTHIRARLTGYAYETIPGKSIIAGATKGPDDAESAASVPMHAPQPSTLGMLALGSPGLSIWRREEQVSPIQ